MAHSVYHAGLGIYLNLTNPDLGHPEMPGLWELLRADKRDVRVRQLQCPECKESRPDCPEWMFLTERDGIRFASHHNPNIADHAASNESDQHKALKERIAQAAERDGFAVELEDRAEHGKRRTDVLVAGADGLLIGHEVQLSYATADSVRKRGRIARDDGITPLWSTTDRAAQWIDRVPWARTDDMPWRLISTGRELLVRGGVRDLAWAPCDWNNPLPCPVLKRGRCGKRHGAWELAHPDLDDLVRDTASGAYVPIIVQQGNRENRMWVRPADRDAYAESAGGLLAESDPQSRKSKRPAVEQASRPLDTECRYGQDSGYRAAPAEIRDTGNAIVTPSTISPAPMPGLAPPPRRPGHCNAMADRDTQARCDAPARFYPYGWRCDEHRR